jgi:hypothetical protein
MAKFYLHIRKGRYLTEDTEGVDLPDVAAARAETVASARKILVESIRSSKRETADCFVITDANGREVATVWLRDVLPDNLCEEEDIRPH